MTSGWMLAFFMVATCFLFLQEDVNCRTDFFNLALSKLLDSLHAKGLFQYYSYRIHASVRSHCAWVVYSQAYTVQKHPFISEIVSANSIRSLKQGLNFWRKKNLHTLRRWNCAISDVYSQRHSLQREEDEYYMKYALKLAEKGLGKTRPNPVVGCCIVSSDGRIIGEGYHHKAGENHAEITALHNFLLKFRLSKIKWNNYSSNTVPLNISLFSERNGFRIKGSDANAAKEILQSCTLYVNLEPCSHIGRTPPCCQALINAQIGRVVVGMEDVNPQVAGNGIKKLIRAGIKVDEGVLEQQCRDMNKPFVYRMSHCLGEEPFATTDIKENSSEKSVSARAKKTTASTQDLQGLEVNFQSINTTSFPVYGQLHLKRCRENAKFPSMSRLNVYLQDPLIDEFTKDCSANTSKSNMNSSLYYEGEERYTIEDMKKVITQIDAIIIDPLLISSKYTSNLLRTLFNEDILLVIPIQEKEQIESLLNYVAINSSSVQHSNDLESSSNVDLFNEVAMEKFIRSARHSTVATIFGARRTLAALNKNVDNYTYGNNSIHYDGICAFVLSLPHTQHATISKTVTLFRDCAEFLRDIGMLCVAYATTDIITIKNLITSGAIHLITVQGEKQHEYERSPVDDILSEFKKTFPIHVGKQDPSLEC